MLNGFEAMHAEEVWKVGMTCNGQNGRYPSGVFYSSTKNRIVLTERQLRYSVIFRGTYKQTLILEKLLIYTYSSWSGHNLIKPPGCKIFR